MFNIQSIFKERFKQHMKLLNRYLRYIFNGHFMIAILFAIVTLAVYYQKWLQTLSADFRADLLIAFMLALVTIYNPIQTFLKDPDKVFLIVREKEMGPYFRRGLLYNYVMQLYIVIFVLAAITPLMQTAYPVKAMGQYVLIYSFVFVVKYIHLLVSWSFIHQSSLFRMIDLVSRFLLTFAILYFSVIEQWLFALVLLALFVLYVVNDYILYKKQPGIYWEALISNDEQQLAKFYQFASMFAEVPAVKRKQKRRKWLSAVVEKSISFSHEQTFRYLFWLTFLRSAEYMSMYIRLTVIGGLAIIFIPHEGFSIGIGVVFMYLTAFQLLPLFSHYRTLIWLDLYPISVEEKQREYLQLVVTLCLIQTIVFAVLFIFVGTIGHFFLFLAIGCLFNYLFHYMYVKKKIAAMA